MECPLCIKLEARIKEAIERLSEMAADKELDMKRLAEIALILDVLNK